MELKNVTGLLLAMVVLVLLLILPERLVLVALSTAL
jgi:hypothetical protein